MSTGNAEDADVAGVCVELSPQNSSTESGRFTDEELLAFLECVEPSRHAVFLRTCPTPAQVEALIAAAADERRRRFTQALREACRKALRRI